MKEYQSFGAGVNSVALAEVMHHIPEKVFADTGCEYPETYAYLDNYPYPITVLNSPVEGCATIEDWCMKLGHAPFMRFRSCTDKFKHARMERYMEKPCTVYIGIAYDEKHRARITEKGRITYKYPLVEQGINRAKCKEIITEAGLPIPPKSGCWLCPFQPKSSWWRLARQHPDLFQRAIKIDELNEKVRLREKGLRGLLPAQNVFEEDDGWECQHCIIM